MLSVDQVGIPFSLDEGRIQRDAMQSINSGVVNVATESPFSKYFSIAFVMQVSWARCGSDFASVFQGKWLHDFRYRVSNNPICDQ